MLHKDSSGNKCAQAEFTSQTAQIAKTTFDVDFFAKIPFLLQKGLLFEHFKYADIFIAL